MSAHQQRLATWKNMFKIDPKTILDVGSSEGNWSDAAKNVFPNSRYFLVDGDDRFTKKLSEKGYDHEICVLYKEETDVEWHKAKANGFVGGHLREEITPFGLNPDNFESVSTKARTLDKVLEENDVEFDSVDFIRIDVQGSELDVLEPCKELLKSHKPIISMVVNLIEYNKGCPLLFEVMKFFDDIGYEMRDIIDLASFKTNQGVFTIQFNALFCEKGKYDVCQIVTDQMKNQPRVKSSPQSIPQGGSSDVMDQILKGLRY